MDKILVTYFSQTGNTKMIAEAIYEFLKGEKEIITIEEVQQIDQYSLIYIGFPVHSHSVPMKLQNFIKKIPNDKNIAFFSTHGSLPGCRLSSEAMEHAVTLSQGKQVIGTFSCRGKVSPKAIDVLKKSPEHKAWTDMAVSADSHPDQNDLEDARAFGKWITDLCS